LWFDTRCSCANVAATGESRDDEPNAAEHAHQWHARETLKRRHYTLLATLKAIAASLKAIGEAT
jgi:hypothetical protein